MKFLSLIDAESDAHSFTTRTKGRKELTRVFHGTYAALEQKLRTFNEDLEGDVWFTVNRTNGTGRTAADITHLRAFFADCDKGPPVKWPVPPSIIVESSPGKIQAYWLIKPIEATPENVARWEAIESALVTLCGADEAAKDVARVLRVPTFINHKYKEKPRVIEVVSDSVQNVQNVQDVVLNVYTCEDLYTLCPTPPMSPVSTRAVHLAAAGVLQEETRRAARYRTWLDAITDPPASGGGKRNAFFFKKSAYGVRELGLDPAAVAEILAEYAERWHGPAAYDEEKLYDIATNAARHGARPVGSGAQMTNVVLDMTDGTASPIPITKNEPASTDEKAKKLRALAIRAKAELAGTYVVIADEKSRLSYGSVAGPGVVIPCDPTVIIGEMIVRYGAELMPTKIKHELLTAWSHYSDKINSVDIRPFVFASEPPVGWAFQRLKFDPDADAPCPGTFKEMLDRTTPEEARSLILWLGSLLDYKFPRTQYLYLWGEGNDGKSTLIRAIMSVFSAQGVASMRSDDIGVHGTARLEGARLVCFVDENTTRFVSSGVFKSITGDDTMTINPKGLALRNIKVFAKVLIASNKSPTVDGGTADYRRILPVQLKSYQNMSGDQGFVDRMMEEGQAIMQYCYSQFMIYKSSHPNELLPAAAERIAEVKNESRQSSEEDNILAALNFDDPDARTTCVALQNRLGGKDKTHIPRYVIEYMKVKGCRSALQKIDGVVRRCWRGVRLTGS